MLKEIRFATNKEVKELLKRKGSHVSLCSSAVDNPAEPEKIRISLKNAANESLEQLSDMKLEDKNFLTKSIRKFIDLNKESKMWKGASLPVNVILGTDGFFQIFATSHSISSGKGIVGRHPYLRPLCQDLNENYEYQVLLQLHKDSIDAFYLGEKVGQRIDSLSTTMEEVLEGYDKEPSLQSHSISSGNNGSLQQKAFHGQGIASDKAWDKKKTMAFFQKWADINHDKINEITGKTVLSGAKNVVVVFKSCGFTKQIDFAPFTIPIAGTGKFDDYYESFLEEVNSSNEFLLKNAVNEGFKISDSKRVIDDVIDIAKLIIMGQVDKLFINLSVFEWNNLDLKEILVSGGLQIYEKETFETGDVLTKLALKNGSKVLYVSDENIQCNYFSTLRADKNILQNYSEGATV